MSDSWARHKCKYCGNSIGMHSDLCEKIKKAMDRADLAEARVKELERTINEIKSLEDMLDI